MTGAIFHNSYDSTYRNPFGAVPCGTAISLVLEVDDSQGVNSVYLRIYQDTSDQVEEFLMERNKFEEGRSKYEVTLSAPEQPQLLWYYFVIEKQDGVVYYGNTSKLGGIGTTVYQEPLGYQITVHDAAACSPQWYKKAVMYQIFVDRFFNGNENGLIFNAKKNSLLHAHWDNEPYYIRDVQTGHVIRWDFFGGNLLGVMKKLPYLRHMGVTVLYLNPIFEAASNHKYDTGDYHKIDPMFGNNELFQILCKRADELGIKIILDGVFSHTGSDSKYFNKDGNYDSLGAYQSKESPYYPWYRFKDFPESYESWWGVDVLPNVNELEPSYMKFIIDDPNSVISYWLKMGAVGWRLDVADELPDEFIKRVHRIMKEFHSDTVLIGEVWEDATNKISYGVRREYLLGSSLDSIMNYPFRVAVLDFLTGNQTAGKVYRLLMSLFENYPREYFYSNMNILGTHDTARVLTALQGDIAKMKLAVLWQMTFPGVPCVYYGDEAGVVGGEDPMNRKTYPWGQENDELMHWYHSLIAVRNAYCVFQTGSFTPFFIGDTIFGYIRHMEDQDVFGNPGKPNTGIVIINVDEHSTHDSLDLQEILLQLPGPSLDVMYDLLSDYREVAVVNGVLSMTLQPKSAVVLVADRWARRGIEQRKAGILMHMSSLPSPYGIGDMGEGAFRFVDFLHQSKQRLWQMLPLNPVGYGNSPYQCDSAFAGNFLFIDLKQLVDEGVLFGEELGHSPCFPDGQVDYEAVAAWKLSLLKRAYMRYQKIATDDMQEQYREFAETNGYWLEEYGLYAALKNYFGQPWVLWEPDVRTRKVSALEMYTEKLATEIGFVKYIQFVFFQQWQRLAEYCQQKNVQLIGDVPIYVAHDSCDVWEHQDLFLLDERGYPTAVAGVPPDYFSETGQLWGNPLYDWQRMKSDRYRWWVKRFAHMQRMFSSVRIDHFRAFADYWSIPSDKVTAVEGKWNQGPGEEFFLEMSEQIGPLALIAEDLGLLSRQARDLTLQTGYPGMSVLQFEMEADRKQPYHLPLYKEHMVAYTGTHDNDTLLGWYGKNQTEMNEFVCTLDEKQKICWDFIKKLYRSDAEAVIVPMQDILCQGSEGRMNIPGTLAGNWIWRMAGDALTEEQASRLADLTELFKRTHPTDC